MRVLVPALLLLAALPAVAAAPPSCASVTTGGMTPVGPYLVPLTETTGYAVWAETNLVEGLQQVECVAVGGATVAPDRYVTKVSVERGGQPVCAPRLGCVWL